MHERQCCCMDICVLYLLVPVTFGTGIITKSVCLEESVKLFENVTFNSQYTVVSLYMNHHGHTLMATWDVQNLTINSYILPEYKEKVYLNKDGSIWIQNVNHWDEENYSIVYGRGTLKYMYKAKIHVKVAPEKNCKPKIRHLDKTLIAYLEDEYCGKPAASLEWLDHPGIYNTSKPVINLSPGKEAGTYYACLKGPALECAKISTLSDYCSSYTIEGNDSPTLASDILDLKTAISMIVPSIIVVSSLVLLIVALYLIPKIRRRCRAGLTSQRSRAECHPAKPCVLAPREDDTDNASMNISAKLHVLVPREDDTDSASMNISESDFLPTRGRKTISIRET